MWEYFVTVLRIFPICCLLHDVTSSLSHLHRGFWYFFAMKRTKRVLITILANMETKYLYPHKVFNGWPKVWNNERLKMYCTQNAWLRGSYLKRIIFPVLYLRLKVYQSGTSSHFWLQVASRCFLNMSDKCQVNIICQINCQCCQLYYFFVTKV